jgi:hypothetical protein
MSPSSSVSVSARCRVRMQHTLPIKCVAIAVTVSAAGHVDGCASRRKRRSLASLAFTTCKRTIPQYPRSVSAKRLYLIPNEDPRQDVESQIFLHRSMLG